MASQTVLMCPMKMIAQRKTTATMSTCSDVLTGSVWTPVEGAMVTTTAATVGTRLIVGTWSASIGSSSARTLESACTVLINVTAGTTVPMVLMNATALSRK